MKCPRCGCDRRELEVERTEQFDTCTRRKLACTECGFTFRTIETPVGDPWVEKAPENVYSG